MSEKYHEFKVLIAQRWFCLKWPFAFLMALLVFGLPASAERFQGRNLIVTDGRAGSGSAPLIVAMDGFLGTARNMQRKTRFDALARKHGFVVAYVNGKRRRWNDGRNPRDGTDDVGYLTAVSEMLIARGMADPMRIFFAGHSNGGGMAMRMACDRPDLVAGISVAATKVPAAFQCANGRPVPAIFFYGTADPIAPHAGRPAGHRLGQTLSADGSLRLWQSRNRCRGAANRRAVDRREDGTKAKIIRFSGCRAALTYVLIDGHGHDWPGSRQRARGLQGPATKEVDAAALSWAFFSRL